VAGGVSVNDGGVDGVASCSSAANDTLDGHDASKLAHDESRTPLTLPSIPSSLLVPPLSSTAEVVPGQSEAAASTSSSSAAPVETAEGGGSSFEEDVALADAAADAAYEAAIRAEPCAATPNDHHTFNTFDPLVGGEGAVDDVVEASVTAGAVRIPFFKKPIDRFTGVMKPMNGPM
jgi:hypothetical protein